MHSNFFLLGPHLRVVFIEFNKFSRTLQLFQCLSDLLLIKALPLSLRSTFNLNLFFLFLLLLYPIPASKLAHYGHCLSKLTHQIDHKIDILVSYVNLDWLHINAKSCLGQTIEL